MANYKTLSKEDLDEIKASAKDNNPDDAVIESLEREHATLTARPKSASKSAQTQTDNRLAEIETILEEEYGVILNSKSKASSK